MSSHQCCDIPPFEAMKGLARDLAGSLGNMQTSFKMRGSVGQLTASSCRKV